MYSITELDPITEHKSENYLAFCFRSLDRTTVSKTEFNFTQTDKGSLKTPNQFSNNLRNSSAIASK